MQTGYVRVFAVALVLGWSAPDLRQPHFGISAEARAKTHTQKKVKKRYQTAQKRAVRKRASNKAVIMPSAPPVRLAMADQQPPSSSLPGSLDVPAPPILPIRGSAGGSPREEPDFEGLKAGKTVEIGGTRGCFRQVSAKPICRLDDIFEPTLGDVIQASGSEVLRFVPDEAASLVSSPILFVQDQRHLIES